VQPEGWGGSEVAELGFLARMSHRAQVNIAGFSEVKLRRSAALVEDLIADILSSTFQKIEGSPDVFGGFWSLDKVLQVRLHWC